MLSRTTREFLTDAAARWGLNRPELAVLELVVEDPNPTIRDLFGKPKVWDDDYVSHFGAAASNGPYDLVLAIESLGTCQRPAEVIADLSKWVRPGGYVVATYRVLGGAPAIGEAPDAPTGLFWKFGPNEVATLFKYSGFDAVDTQPDMDDPGFFTVAQRRLRDVGELVGKLGFRAGDEIPIVEQHYV